MYICYYVCCTDCDVAQCGFQVLLDACHMNHSYIRAPYKFSVPKIYCRIHAREYDNH